MGRCELPVDYTVRARGDLAAALRELRAEAGLTYDELASRTGVSAATLKRAASGRTVPSWKTFSAFTEACCNVDGAVMSQLRREFGELTGLWRSARVAERGRLKTLRRPPAPELITTAGQLSEALEYFYEKSGAPPLRQLQAQAGGAYLLPVSSAARIVARQALPASPQQCVAFLTALGLVPGMVQRLAHTYYRITAHPTDSWRGPTDPQTARVHASDTSDTTDRPLGLLRMADLRHRDAQVATRRREALVQRLLTEPMRVGRDGPSKRHFRAA
ncbi:helix-turn-helix domain-containing protein [Streptomyces lavendulae]|uniref:helix-turn-helix domain-containing protein n=1 Tax=Streptomyces lavendulae TaxID=1914 RepID=UPI0036CE5526